MVAAEDARLLPCDGHGGPVLGGFAAGRSACQHAAGPVGGERQDLGVLLAVGRADELHQRVEILLEDGELAVGAAGQVGGAGDVVVQQAERVHIGLELGAVLFVQLEEVDELAGVLEVDLLLQLGVVGDDGQRLLLVDALREQQREHRHHPPALQALRQRLVDLLRQRHADDELAPPAASGRERARPGGWGADGRVDERSFGRR